MLNPFRRRVEYVTLTKPEPGLVVRGLGTRFPSVKNNTDEPVRITFRLAGTTTNRSVDVRPYEVAPFHVRDGKFRADIIEIISEENNGT